MHPGHQETLKRLYGVDVSPDLVSRVSDGIVDELKEWQNRPLDAVYPILYIDALVVKVRTSGTVVNRPGHLAVGVDVEGRKHVLGVWLGDGGEGAKFWLAVLTEFKARGCRRSRYSLASRSRNSPLGSARMSSRWRLLRWWMGGERR